MAIMDAIDKKILVLIQENAAQPVAEIARKVGLSVTPCWRRIQRLEESGVIRKRVALLDGKKIKASFKDGLLSVEIPKVEPVKPEKHSVKIS